MPATLKKTWQRPYQYRLDYINKILWKIWLFAGANLLWSVQRTVKIYEKTNEMPRDGLKVNSALGIFAENSLQEKVILLNFTENGIIIALT